MGRRKNKVKLPMVIEYENVLAAIDQQSVTYLRGCGYIRQLGKDIFDMSLEEADCFDAARDQVFKEDQVFLEYYKKYKEEGKMTKEEFDDRSAEFCAKPEAIQVLQRLQEDFELYVLIRSEVHIKNKMNFLMKFYGISPHRILLMEHMDQVALADFVISIDPKLLESVTGTRILFDYLYENTELSSGHVCNWVDVVNSIEKWVQIRDEKVEGLKEKKQRPVELLRNKELHQLSKDSGNMAEVAKTIIDEEFVVIDHSFYEDSYERDGSTFSEAQYMIYYIRQTGASHSYIPLSGSGNVMGKKVIKLNWNKDKVGVVAIGTIVSEAFDSPQFEYGLAQGSRNRYMAEVKWEAMRTQFAQDYKMVKYTDYAFQILFLEGERGEALGQEEVCSLLKQVGLGA